MLYNKNCCKKLNHLLSSTFFNNAFVLADRMANDALTLVGKLSNILHLNKNIVFLVCSSLNYFEIAFGIAKAQTCRNGFKLQQL